MTSRGNLNTLRQLFNWNSTWYNKTFYKQLLFRDLVLEMYLTGIFYKLRIPSSYFLIKNVYFSFYIIETDLYILKKQKITFLVFNISKYTNWAKIFFLTYSQSFIKKKDINITFKIKKSYIVLIKQYQYYLIFFLRALLFLSGLELFFLDTITNRIESSKILLVNYTLQKKTNLLFSIYTMLTNKPSYITKSTHYQLTINSYVLSIKNCVSLFLVVSFFKEILNQNLKLKYIFFSFPILRKWVFIFEYFYKTKDLTRKHKKMFLLSRFYTRLCITSFNSKKYTSLSFRKNIYKFWVVKYLISMLYNSESIFLMINLYSYKLLYKKYYLIYESLTNIKYVFHSLFYPIWKLNNRNISIQKSICFLHLFLKRSVNTYKKYLSDFFFYDYYKQVLNYLSNRIEYTISSYLNIQCFFSPTIFLNFKPFIKNSKLICEYIAIHLENGSSINHVWKKIKGWIDTQHFISDMIESDTLKNRILWLSRNSLKGIRIVCKGPNYKARRKRKFVFHSWVSDDSVTGKMPVQSFNSQVDYYQSFVVLKQATIGIKVWTLFEFIKKN